MLAASRRAQYEDYQMKEAGVCPALYVSLRRFVESQRLVTVAVKLITGSDQKLRWMSGGGRTRLRVKAGS